MIVFGSAQFVTNKRPHPTLESSESQSEYFIDLQREVQNSITAGVTHNRNIYRNGSNDIDRHKIYDKNIDKMHVHMYVCAMYVCMEKLCTSSTQKYV